MKLSRIFRWVFITLVCAFVAIQFIRPAKTNPAIDPTQTIESRLQVSPQAEAILDRSCNDCHSNKTRWPWYSNVAPVSWLVISDVDQARINMNLSEWGKRDRDRQSKKLQQMCDEVTDGAMPLSVYTPMHPGSKLSADDVKTLCDWANGKRQRMVAK